MSLVPLVGRKSPGNRLFIAFVYLVLSALGVTMVVPFLITLSGSTTNDFDYDRFRPIPRYFRSESDRFVKGLVYYFNYFRGWKDQLQCQVPGAPEHWSSWNIIGRDLAGVDALAGRYLNVPPETRARQRRMAADYAAFTDGYRIEDTVVTVINPQAVNFMRQAYEGQFRQLAPEAYREASRKERREAALDLLGKRWGLPYESFYNVNFDAETGAPMDFQSWFPAADHPKQQDFIRLKEAYRSHVFTPGVKARWLRHARRAVPDLARDTPLFPVTPDAPEALQTAWRTFKAEHAPASPTLPYALRAAWLRFLQSEEAGRLLGLPDTEAFSIHTYNRLAGTDYPHLLATPFPVPADAEGPVRTLYRHFVENAWPLRLTTIEPTPERQAAYQEMLKRVVIHLPVANELLGTAHADWSEFVLTAAPPPGDSEVGRNRRNVWMQFVKSLPLEARILTCSEIAYQAFLLDRYGTLEAINRQYGWSLNRIEEAFPPFIEAYTVTFLDNQRAFTTEPILRNYRVIGEYLLLNANAVPVTLALIMLAVLCTLTINPLAAYAMSRFNLRGKELILLYMLATMAFPAMVSAIPAYLLMRDLNLLNTFFALVLPGAANGMAIFILKGFFDSLPQELFEAATIDGASEPQIFRIVAMPMVKPILAINSLAAFIAAYNGWEWALIVCQDQQMWTIAVWLYQANAWWERMPWLVSAGFVVASLPTLIVFLSCQKIILKGIIIPSMK